MVLAKIRATCFYQWCLFLFLHVYFSVFKMSVTANSDLRYALYSDVTVGMSITSDTLYSIIVTSKVNRGSSANIFSYQPFYARDILRLSFLSVCLSVVNFNLRYDF